MADAEASLPNSIQVLLVEDDPAIASTVVYSLEREGMSIRHCLQLTDARVQWQGQPFALLVLDVGLPDGNGLDWCRELRAQGVTTPVLVLSARGEEMDKVLGLELGADDYLSKPFSPRELVARVRALVRRAQYVPLKTPIPVVGLRIDEVAQRIFLQEHALDLTRREYQLLRHFLERPGRILSREFLLDSVWGQTSDSLDRTVDTHIKTLRAKMREVAPQLDLITTHRGMGYSLELPHG